jgi:D-alanine--poly(phosphoribitol) ligase subunit 2
LRHSHGPARSHGGPLAQAQAVVLELIRDRLNIEVTDIDLDLIESGMLDSLALVTLITAIEERFETELPLDDFDLDNFRSARRIAECIADLAVVPARNAS